MKSSDLKRLAKRYNELVSEGQPIYVKLVQEFKLCERQLRTYIAELRDKGLIIKHRRKHDKEEQTNQITTGTERSGEMKGATYVESNGQTIRTLNELLAVCDPDLQKFTVTDHVVNKWDTTMKVKVGNKWEVVTRTNWQVKAWFRMKRAQEVLEMVADEIIQDIETASKKRFTVGAKPTRHGETLLEIGLFDFHVGNLVWHLENVEDWDLSLAEHVFRKSVTLLLDDAQRRYDVDRILYPIGNDFFHADSKDNKTTAGTQMELDTRWQKLFRTGVEMQKWAIELMRDVAPVDVIVVPGNHDEQSAFTMGMVLEAMFGHTNDVQLLNDPRLRKYYVWGNTLLGFTHGKFEKQGSLPQLMATEAKKAWGETVYREFHIGHRHHRHAQRFMTDYVDDEGVLVRMLPTLAAVDAYHTNSGYVGAVKAAEAYLFDLEAGLIGTLHTQREQTLRSDHMEK